MRTCAADKRARQRHLSDRGCPPRRRAWHDELVSIRSVDPLGTFHARAPRDGEAHRREGETFVLLNDLGDDDRGGRLVEVMFEDGIWMLATAADLDMSEGRTGL